MEKETIYLIRAGLKQELENYVGNSAKIKLNNKTVEEILFNVDEIGMKTFAFPIELMKKINFEGISFDNFFAFGFDFTGFKGISIDPQKVFDKNLSYANLNGVTIINTFDDVKLDNVQIDGMLYKTWELKAKKLVKTRNK